MNALPLEETGWRPVKKAQTKRRIDNSGVSGQDSCESDEEEDSYNPRPIPVYRMTPIRSQTAHSKPQLQLNLSAHEFRPVRNMSPDKESITEQEAAHMAEQTQTQSDFHSVREGEVPQEVNDDVQNEQAETEEPDLEPLIEQTVRKSSRVPRPRGMFTYTSLGQPSYQPLFPGVNSVFQCVPYGTGMPSLVFPDVNFVPRPVVWTY